MTTLNAGKPLPSIRLHAIRPFDRSAKARWLLTELSIPHQDRWLVTEEKSNETPEFLRMNPQGRVPVIEVDDLAFYESSALCAYLADRFSLGSLAPALDSIERAKYQQWMYFAAATLDTFPSRIMIIEDIPAGELRTRKESQLIEEVQDAVTALDHALQKGDYLLSTGFSAADICVSYHLYFCTLWPELAAPLEASPRVTAYLKRLRAMPSAKKADVFSFPEE